MNRVVPDQPTYGIEGACAYLRVSETSLRDLVISGELACSKPGKEPVFRKQVLDDYLTRLEIEQTALRKEAFERGVKPVVQTAVSQVRRRKPLPVLPVMKEAA
ncbi:MAG TPA: helix-turn-helix domain-containing protein [Sideroxyarcus sp.]|nr:helix-turn-helix domain-containing protein [Sideroxyarcus sp.]